MQSSRPVRLGVQISEKDSEALRQAFNRPPHVQDKPRRPVQRAFPRSRRSGRDGWSTRLFKWTMGWKGKYKVYFARLVQLLLVRWFATRIADDLYRANPASLYVIALQLCLFFRLLRIKQLRLDRRTIRACVLFAIREEGK